MKKAKPTAPRVVMSLQMSRRTHTSVKRAAVKAGENVSEFVRKAAESRAADVLASDDAAKATQQVA